MDSIFLSVITPTYNSVEFIENCINNVISQGFINCEHIIVDGGSLDGTTDIIKSYASKYKHIKWLSEKDEGQSDAMNKGISLAKGSVISFLNVDDYYYPNVFNLVDHFFSEINEPTFLVGNCTVHNLKQNISFSNKPDNLSFENIYLSIHKGMFSHDPNVFPFNPSAYFYHKVIHDIIGLYDLNDHFTMDFEFILRVLLNDKISVRYLNEDFGNFVQHESSKTLLQMQSGNSEKNIRDILSGFVKRLSLFKQVMLKLKLHLPISI